MPAQEATLRRHLQQCALVAGTAVFSVFVTMVVMPGPASRQAVAQPGQATEVRASEFVLVGQDGAVLARMAPGQQGFGNLTLFDTAGTAHLGLAGAGALNIFGSDGTTFRLRVGFTRTGEALMAVFDAAGNPRVRIGELAAGGAYGVEVLDADGQRVATFP